MNKYTLENIFTDETFGFNKYNEAVTFIQEEIERLNDRDGVGMWSEMDFDLFEFNSDKEKYCKIKIQLPISSEKMDMITTYMNDEIREQVHFELAPCKPEEFLKRYLELDPEFEEVLRNEFNL